MTQTLVRVVGGCMVMAAFAVPAAAQNERRIGFSFAFPSAVGVQWDVTDKFSLRADGDFLHNRSELTSDLDFLPPSLVGSSLPSTTTVNTSQVVSIGVTAMWAIHSSDQLKVYVAPRIAVNILNRESETNYDVSGIPPALLAILQLPAQGETRSETDTMPEYSVGLGASYRLASRFAVFAETGFSYSRGSLGIGSGLGLESRQTTFGLRGGVGGILYF